MLPVLQVGPLAIQVPGLLVLLGIWLASLTVARTAVHLGLERDALDRILLIGMVSGVLGARIGHVLQNPAAYAQDPRAILSFNLTAFAPLEGVVAGLLAALVYGQRKALPFWLTLDALASGAAVLAVFVALSHMASGDAYGAPTDLPWAIELWGAWRHPAQLYELAAFLVLLVVLTQLRRRHAFPGELVLGWLALASGARLLLEAFRGDSLYLVGVRQAQVAALIVLMASLGGLHWRARRHLTLGGKQGAGKRPISPPG